MRGLDECQECVFCSDGYADVDLGINLYCTHPTYARHVAQCPTVLSYAIKRKLLYGEDEETPELKIEGKNKTTDGQVDIINLGSLKYVLAPFNVNVATTKGAVENYVKQSICDYLDLLVRNDCFQREYDGSGYDSAIKNVREYIDEVIKELREGVEKSYKEEDKE